jgi:2-oxoisovalerate dehydrogenase E1 component
MTVPPETAAPTSRDGDVSVGSELRDFLALEAPHLLELVDTELSEPELEQALLAAVRGPARRAGSDDGDLFPGTSRREAIEWAEGALEIAVEGFFERLRLRRAIDAEDRRLMLRTMLLTRELDRHLKSAFDDQPVRWRDYPSPQKGFRSLGQEAVVSAALRLRRPPEYPPGRSYAGDYISPVIRDLGVLLMFKPDPLHVLLVQYGKRGTPVGGRDLHSGDYDWGVLPPAAPLTIGTQTAIGLSYAHKLRGQDRVCVSFIGDGGSSLGEWHEAINFAAVQRLAMVFVIENNQWALGTHVSEQTAARRFALRAAGYGIPGLTVFGNDPDRIAAATAWAAERARGGAGPTLVELVTYRRPGHAHHDDDRFHGNREIKVPGYEHEDERARWEAADPIDLYRSRLVSMGVVTAGEIETMRDEVAREVEEAARAAAAAPWPEPSDYRDRVYAPRRPPESHVPERGPTRRVSYDEAVRLALTEMMEEDEGVFVLGEDVGGRYGGAFGVTRGLARQFGEARCLNTPLAESAIVGCAVGAALAGARPVVEMQFADFLAPGFNALVNNAAKVHWRWGRPVPMVVRLPYGGATGTLNRLLGGGPFHSQCPEMWFFRTPGWKIVAPATPADAKGLMIAAIRDPNPVIFLEAKGLYGFFRDDLREEVPLGTGYEVPMGRAAVKREGDDLTLVTYGAMVWTALEAADRLADEGITAEVVDLRSLWPLDEQTIASSVEKTNRLLVLHEDTRRGGLAGEIAAVLGDRAFFHLDAPIRRVTAPDTPVPYSPPLEYDFLPKAEQVVEAARALVEV